MSDHLLKIFKIDDATWWAAESAQAAIECYERETGEEVLREEGYPEELTDEEMDTLVMAETDENERPTGRKPTFREFLAENPVPGFFASSEW